MSLKLYDQTCRSCLYRREGECRAEPPKVIAMAQSKGLVGGMPIAVGGWPTLQSNDGWCAHHTEVPKDHE